MNAQVMSWIIFLVIGLVAGYLASILVKGRGLGLVWDIVVGVIGAFLGGWLFSFFNVSAGGGLLGSIITAFIGAVVLLIIIKLIRKA